MTDDSSRERRFVDDPPEPSGGSKPHRKRIQFVSVARPGAAINVTPLVDVVLVLLIIFMVVTPTDEKNLDVQLTQDTAATASAKRWPELLTVRVHRDSLLINDEPVARAAYLPSLRGLLAKRDPDDRVVFVAATDDTSYASLVEVVDAARQAGASQVGLVTEEVPMAEVEDSEVP